MGEGRRDRSSNRHRPNLGIEKSSSDTEVARSKIKGRKVKSKFKGKWPFLDGITVDELGRYRRRRVQNHPKDTLGTYQTSDIRENLVTEYRRAFRATSEDSILKILDNPSTRLPDEITNPRIDKDFEQLVPTDLHPQVQQGSLKTDEDTVMETAVEISRCEGSPISGTRRMLIRGTSLKRQGHEFYTNTESSSYAPYEGRHRAELARRPTSLKMEGKMETTTEQCEKFIEWLNVSRPEIVRLPSHLKLEGDLETTTENHEKYVPFVGARRPELLRQIAHLQLEGECTFLPEYTEVFREHGVCEKQMPFFPESYFKTGGEFNEMTGTCQNYSKPMNTHCITDDPGDEVLRQMTNREEDTRPNKEKDMRISAYKLEDSKGPPLEVPEYKDAYKDFPRERPKLVRPQDEISRADGSKVQSTPGHIQFPTKIDQDLEYKSKFLDADRLVFRKPPISLRSITASSGFGGRISRDFQRHEPTSEVRSQYVSHGQVPRIETLRMPANLRLEGNIDLQPEYQVAYCTKKENVMTDEPRIHRHRDRSVSELRKQDSSWINSNNGEQFGRITSADEQDAFQVLNTRAHDESVVAKPPPGTKRGSKSSEWQTPTSHRPMDHRHLDIATSSSGLRNRSPSPTYRLHVYNPDDELRSFDNRRLSPSLKMLGRERSPSIGHLNHLHDLSQRSYSPSFGKTLHKNTAEDEHAFVVLENARNDYSPFNRIHKKSRKVIDRNCNATESVLSHPKNTTPTNWMPPWYDNTNTA